MANMLAFSLPVHAKAGGAEVDPIMSRIDGIAQIAQVPPFSITAKPRHVFCGAEVPCPEPTAKTLAMAPVAPARVSAPVDRPPVVVAESPKTEPIAPKVDVRFAFASHVLTKQARADLDGFAAKAQHIEGPTRIVVSGYTDSVGTKKFNDRLAKQRAEAVKKHLISAGLDGRRIRVVAAGKCCYVATNDTEAGRAANRRAEVASSISVSIEKE